MSLISRKSITEDDRQRWIIEFISSNPYCNAEEVVQGLKDRISRVTVFKMLRRLIDSGAVKIYLENEQKRNARDHKLFVDEGNPLVSVRLELDEFDRAFFDFFNKEMKEFELLLQALEKSIQPVEEKTNDIEELKKRLHSLENYDTEHFKVWFLHARAVEALLDIFYSMVDAYSFRFLFIWSEKISDQKVLQQLYSMVFLKIADMQRRLSERQKSLPVRGRAYNILRRRLIHQRFRVLESDPGPIVRSLDSFESLGRKEEVEPVIDALWKIIGELQLDIYPEPRVYHWRFKYGEDDWRKLVNLLRQHNNLSTFGKTQTYKREDWRKYKEEDWRKLQKRLRQELNEVRSRLRHIKEKTQGSKN